jgi:hypothetical protein
MPLKPSNEFSTLKAEVYHSSNVEKWDGKKLSLNATDDHVWYLGDGAKHLYIVFHKVHQQVVLIFRCSYHLTL